jgi:hypothetical protein
LNGCVEIGGAKFDYMMGVWFDAHLHTEVSTPSQVMCQSWDGAACATHEGGQTLVRQRETHV